MAHHCLNIVQEKGAIGINPANQLPIGFLHPIALGEHDVAGFAAAEDVFAFVVLIDVNGRADDVDGDAV